MSGDKFKFHCDSQKNEAKTKQKKNYQKNVEIVIIILWIFDMLQQKGWYRFFFHFITIFFSLNFLRFIIKLYVTIELCHIEMKQMHFFLDISIICYFHSVLSSTEKHHIDKKFITLLFSVMDVACLLLNVQQVQNRFSTSILNKTGTTTKKKTVFLSMEF